MNKIALMLPIMYIYFDEVNMGVRYGYFITQLQMKLSTE